ncbi:MAG TPA: hypothetical protein HPP83_00015 [Candidatus Hydrogenedentes bacterium]|nr:hypothetical protein [Candidatus Hydrogenedentota bacterium]
MNASAPIWPEGRETEMNVFAGFRAVVDMPEADEVVLRIAASSVYRAFIDGAFCGHGPARAAHGYFRVDEWDLASRLAPGRHVIAFEVAGYNVNSYYLVNQPAFLQAELVADGQVLASTAGAGVHFAGTVLNARVQKAQRYSFQRPFTEVYRLAPGGDRWRADPDAAFKATDCPGLPEKRYLPRHVAYPTFDVRTATRHVSRGTVRTNEQPGHVFKDRSLTGIGPSLLGYRAEELDTIPSIEMQTLAIERHEDVGEALTPDTRLDLPANTFHVVDFGLNLTGFFGARVACTEKTRLLFVFDEILTNEGDVNFLRMGSAQLVTYELGPGTYELEAFEPYTLRYLKVLVLDGACRVSGVYIREYANPDAGKGRFQSSDERLNRIFEAGRQSSRQNSPDTFMDCPSRERAPWLCDSTFAARAAFALSGNTAVERNFFENYLLLERLNQLPEGMLPMCYPADHYDGVFIPNWALWFVVQLEEYLARSGDRPLADALKPKVLALFDYLRKFKNADGLLEKLDSWVFVEWSRANEFVQDVNYPTNMLYAGALDAAHRVYGLPDCAAEAKAVRDVIKRQSFDGEFFVDNALRQDNDLVVTRNRSEVCQYYAFFFGVATPETHPDLWRVLRNEFGPRRKQSGAYPEVHMANFFVGDLLRLDLLARFGHVQQFVDESIEFLLCMAEQTGTLWEHDTAAASCCHGFGAHICHQYYRDVLGLRRIDPTNKTVEVQLPDLELQWCDGEVPVPDGVIKMRWWKKDGAIRHEVAVPRCYRVNVQKS